MASAFPHVFFDIDHTLFDFEASKRVAFAGALGEIGITDWEPLLPILSAVEQPLWHSLENGTTTLDTLNVNRFEGLVAEANLDIDPAPLAASYLVWLGHSGGLLDGARELLDSLAETHTLAMLSNGYASVQRARLANFDLDRYFTSVVISDEIGVAKPHGRFFDIALETAGRPALDSVLMVGDNLRSDIGGGAAAGLATCWYNPSRTPADDTSAVTFEVNHLTPVDPLAR